MAPTALKVFALGQESTWGTPVAATARLMGVTDSEAALVVEHRQTEELGSLAPSRLVSGVRVSAMAGLTMDVSYEDILYLTHGLFGSVAPSGTNPYTYTYVAPGAAVSVPKFWTIEYGQAGVPYQIEGAILTKLTISGDIDGDGVWIATPEYIAQDANLLGSFAALSDRIVNPIPMHETTLYIDAEGGTMGATIQANVLKSFSFTVDTGRHLKWFGGSILPGEHGERKWTGELTFVAEFGASAKAILDALIATAGLASTQKRLIQIMGFNAAGLNTKIQFGGYLSPAPRMFEDNDGNITIEMKWIGSYNTVLANWLRVLVTNAVASVV